VKIAARILGTGRDAFGRAIEYAQDRVQGGVPIIEHQMVQNRVAEMATNLETARSMAWRAAAAADEGQPDANKLGIIARIHAADAVLETAEHAVEIHGGAGTMRAQGIERLMRDAVVNMHLHGTQDIHKIKLVNELTGEGDPGTHA
jgi:alkylation response protein AidB-like acyl-CoA dehydrogenase